MRRRSSVGLFVAALVVRSIASVAASAPAAAEAMASLERALADDPENLRVAADYRQIAISVGEFDRPISFIEKLTKRKNAGPNVFISLALAYVDKVPTSGEIRRLYLGRDAMNAATKALEQQPSTLAYYIRGQINLYYNNLVFHRIPRGIDDLQKALSVATPATPAILVAQVHLSIGDGYWKLGEHARARESWTRGLALFPDHERLRERLKGDEADVNGQVIRALWASTRVDTTLHGVVP